MSTDPALTNPANHHRAAAAILAENPGPDKGGYSLPWWEAFCIWRH